MARVAVTVEADAEERRAVEAILGSDAAWLVDAPPQGTLAGAEVALSFWPRRELRHAGKKWEDFPALRLVQLATAGVNHVGWRSMPQHVAVASAPGSSGPMVAEHVLAFLLWWTRRLGPHDRAIRDGHFRVGAPVTALGKLKVGIVGFGGVGQAVAHLLAPFGTTLRAVSRSGEADAATAAPLDRLDAMDRLDGLAAWADALVLCLPLVQETVDLVDAELLARMAGREALLVNVARGHIVEEQALYDWLAADPARHAAALDVWWRYPDADGEWPFTQPFHRLPNVVMTPHDAPNVAGFRVGMLRQAAGQVRHFLDTGEMLHVQDREAHLVDVEADGR